MLTLHGDMDGQTRAQGDGRPRRVVVAGATGFVGRALVHALQRDYEVVGITRSAALPPGTPPGERGLRWVTADLFSLLGVERALEGADTAFFLVHSRLPSAELTQGRVADLDLILADNFGRAARAQGVRHLVCLGGLVPESGEVSPSLRAWLEVEQALRTSGVPFTALRAGLVLGPGGSAFHTVEHLVRRLPVVLLPRWARTPTQPIALEDLVALLRWCLEHPERAEGVADVGGPDVATSRQVLEETARALGLRRRVWQVPALPAGLWKLWVSLVSRVSLRRVSPLVDSLRHPLLVRDGWLQQRAGVPGRALPEALREAVSPRARECHHALLPAPWLRPHRDVRSVQRLPLPPGWSAEDVAREYARWLPRFMWPLLRVEVSPEGVYDFRARGLNVRLLQLSHSAARSTPDRQLLYLTGGVLVRVERRPLQGRFEFREALGKRCVLAGIHNFTPALPWFLYKFTQALVHQWVMRSFGRHLGRVGRARLAPAPAPLLPSGRT